MSFSMRMGMGLGAMQNSGGGATPAVWTIASDADGTKTDKNWKEVKVRWVLDETFSEKDTYDGETPGTYVFDAELKSSRYELDTGFLPRIEVTVQ